MFRHDNAQPYVSRICKQFLEAENAPVIPWPAYSPDMSPIEHILDALNRRVGQRVPIPATIQELHTAIEEELDNISQATYNQQPDQLYAKETCRAA
jgi:transposase